MRLGAIFVAVCMTVIAASAGAVVYFAYGFTGADAIIVAIAALTALALYNAVSTRMNVKSVVGPQLTELVARQRRPGAAARRGGAAAGSGRSPGSSTASPEARRRAEPLAMEISELGALIDQLAGTVANHETQLKEIELSGIERAEAERARAAVGEARALLSRGQGI